MTERLKRINELAHKAKTVGLTPEEDAERAKLRREYLDIVLANAKQQLDNTVLVDENGNRRPLKRKP